jgi:hypothetical protein
MITIAQAKASVEPFFQKIRAWDWRCSPAAAPAFGHVSSRSDWIDSLAAERWEPLRHRWRNEISQELNANRVAVADWNAVVREVRGELEVLLAAMMGDQAVSDIADSVRWDVLLGWQAMVMVPRSPYVSLLELYASGWLVGGPIHGDGINGLAVIEACKMVSV